MVATVIGFAAESGRIYGLTTKVTRFKLLVQGLRLRGRNGPHEAVRKEDHRRMCGRKGSCLPASGRGSLSPPSAAAGEGGGAQRAPLLSDPPPSLAKCDPSGPRSPLFWPSHAWCPSRNVTRGRAGAAVLRESSVHGPLRDAEREIVRHLLRCPPHS